MSRRPSQRALLAQIARLEALRDAARRDAREADMAWEIATRNGHSAYSAAMSERAADADDRDRALTERIIALYEEVG